MVGTEPYTNSAGRVTYCATRYARWLRGRVLDVGCGKAPLRAHCQEYVGVDRRNEADWRLDLEHGLPFEDRLFDTVVCLDVLEHVEHLYELADDLCRVTKGALILSLPNCWASLRRLAVLGRGETSQYGLEPRPDRHRWFFNYEEAEVFVHRLAARHGLRVAVCEPFWRPAGSLTRLWRALYAWDRGRQRNLFAETLWAVLERP